ncbi:hypothetical protein OAO55_00780 [Bacteroidales bacterium]|nr:hypothetical protein [Bacteroidales bacterium]
MKTTTTTIKIVITILLTAIGQVLFAQPANYEAIANVPVDSISIGGTSSIFYLPDLTLNTAFDPANPEASGLNSSFSWNDDGGNVTIIDHYTGGTAITNWIDYTANIIGRDSISVQEIATTGACMGIPLRIAYRVINLPTANFTANNSFICAKNLDTLSYNFPVALTTDMNDDSLRIYISIDGPISNGLITEKEIRLAESDTDFMLANVFTEGPGEYNISITRVDDRIARKSGVSGTSTTRASYSLTINVAPSTGTLYHLQNSGW